jgi:hypothetical protein
LEERGGVVTFTLASLAIGQADVMHRPDQRDALEIARGCPHLRHGGGIVVRPIAPV